MLDTPVLFLIYRRPDTTLQVFNQIRKAQPRQLFVVADGPKPDRPEETELCRQARAIIDQVDWDCEVKTNYSDVNLGCRERVSSGITWFFEHVEEGIILEDDTVPDVSFFKYCKRLLKHFRYDERVMMVSGYNSLELWPCEGSYFFTRMGKVWGWATWKRAWDYYDPELTLYHKLTQAQVRSLFYSYYEYIHYRSLFEGVLKDKYDSWGYQWHFACLSQNGLAMVPDRNLVSNIGFDQRGTHTTRPGGKHARVNKYSMYDNLIDPSCMIPDRKYEELVFERFVHYQKYMCHDPVSRLKRYLRKKLG